MIDLRRIQFVLGLFLIAGLAWASLEPSYTVPQIRLPAGLVMAPPVGEGVVLVARSERAALLLTKLQNAQSRADHFSLNSVDAEKLAANGAKVETRLRSFQTASGKNLLAVEAALGEQTLISGYVNGPDGTYSLLASGLTREIVADAVATMRLPGELIAAAAPAPEPAPETAPLQTPAVSPLPAVEIADFKDALAPLPPAPKPKKNPMIMYVMVAVGLALSLIGLFWRAVSWRTNSAS